MHVLLLISLIAAQTALQDFDAVCRAEGGTLWGRSLCGPIVLVDPLTREAVASADGRVFETKMPESIGIANTSVEWEGRAWTMVMWPLPDDALARRRLLAHESFHRLQKNLGFPSTGPSNAHLDTADARYWLRLEWRALAEALKTRNRRAIQDALAFRARRHALATNAAEEERLLEMHEGLAEHTGFAVAQPKLAARAESIAKALTRASEGDSFVRSFAYASGPAWGALLEMRDPKWTRSLKATDDLASLARRKWRADVPSAPREARYGGKELRAAEDAREARKREERAALRAKFVDGPVLTLPLGQIQLVFDPHGLQPLDDLGTVYRKIEIADAWGKIVVTGGALLTADWKLVVPASGEGWTLTLNEGWGIVDGGRSGDKTVEKR